MALPFHREVVRAALEGDRKCLVERLAFEAHDIMIACDDEPDVLAMCAAKILQEVIRRALWEAPSVASPPNFPGRALVFLDDRDLAALQVANREWRARITTIPDERAGDVRDAVALACDALLPFIPQARACGEIEHPATTCRAARATGLSNTFVKRVFAEPGFF